MRDLRLRALRDAPEAFASTFELERHLPAEYWRARLLAADTFLCRLGSEAWGSELAPVGLVVVQIAPGLAEEAKLVSLWVDPGARRLGAADTLMAAALTSATAHGRHLKLYVVETNVAARRLYERHGFVRTGAEQRLDDGRIEVEMTRGPGRLEAPASG